MTDGASPKSPTLLAKEAAWTLAPRGLQLTSGNLFLRRLYFPAPKPPDVCQGGQERPRLLERPTEADLAGTHPTATRRQLRAGRTMSASQAAANRPSGEPGPRGEGTGPSCSEFHSERSADPGSCGSSRKTQPTASAKKPAYTEPRHSAMGTEALEQRCTAPFPARASSGLCVRRRQHARHVTPARRSPLEGRGEGGGMGVAEERRTVFLGPNPGTWGRCSAALGEVGQRQQCRSERCTPFQNSSSTPKIEEQGYVCFPSKMKQMDFFITQMNLSHLKQMDFEVAGKSHVTL